MNNLYQMKTLLNAAIQLYLIFEFMLGKCSTSDFKDTIQVEQNKIIIKYDSSSKGFHQNVDISIFDNVAPINCAETADQFCLKWSDIAKFQIRKKDSKCNTYEFTSKLEKPLRVRFDTHNVYLYGGFEEDYQNWPTDYSNFEKYPFVSSEKNSQAVLEPFWLVTNGVYLYVDKKTPLFITQRKRQHLFEIIADKVEPYEKGGLRELVYTVCKLDNMKEAYYHAVNNFLGKPLSIPDETIVKYPIWSTWAKYKAEVDSKVVLEFADMIIQSKLPNSQLEIDDKWETCYGSLTVDKQKFPDMKNTVQRLKSMGFRVTIWIHPFINLDCNPYHQEARRKGYFVKDKNGNVETPWWNGRGSYIDFTNAEAVSWFQARLNSLKSETGIDSFKFDAGESSFSPQPPVYKLTQNDYPETILKTYVQAVSTFGPMVEVRSARGTQQLPIFVRMIDRETNWDKRLGLTTLIPALLHMNMIGYPFVLPDMIGGNGYNNMVVTPEMFVRWLQANVFMPAIQFSYPPWDFGDEVLKQTQKLIELHVKYSDKIIAAMKKSVEDGTPVNQPLWWVDPKDHQTYEIDSEFLLGDILVAPVTEEGARSRDIYFPKGSWKDENSKDASVIKGPCWINNYPADLSVLPYFSKVADDDKDKTEDKDKTDHKHQNSASSSMPSLIFVSFSFVIIKLFKLLF